MNNQTPDPTIETTLVKTKKRPKTVTASRVIGLEPEITEADIDLPLSLYSSGLLSPEEAINMIKAKMTDVDWGFK